MIHVSKVDRAENVIKGESACYQHFLLILQCFQKLSLPESLKLGVQVKEYSLFSP